MTVIANDDPGRSASLRRLSHERLSDHGTHSVIGDILSSGFLPKRPSGYATPRVEVSLFDVQTTLFPALKTAGLRRAIEIASRARTRAEDPNRGWPTVTLAAICAEVLFDSQVRRGAVPSLEGRLCRQKALADALSREAPLRLAVLLFPVRDRNPAKNDGPSPDLGEVDALVQLWTITKALECVRETFVAERLTVIQRALGCSLQSHRQVYGVLGTVMEPRASVTTRESSETVKLAIGLARQNKERITQRIVALGEELSAYTIHDLEKAAVVLLELARESRSLSWLFEGREVQAEQPISVLAIRDARRYPCFFSEPTSDIQHYKDALSHIHELLRIGDSVVLTAAEELELRADPLELELFQINRERIYQEKKCQYLSILEPIKEDLLVAGSREELLQRISSIDKSGKTAPIFEAILHSRYHEPLIEWSSQFGADAPQQVLHFLATIYERRCDLSLESLRKQLLWETLVGAVEYIASYESNSQGSNRLQLDDVEFLAPGSVRLSIHQKPEQSGHFAVQVGASVCRTPWHGTAFLREHSGGKGYVLESRLALELKYDEATPVFIDGKLGEQYQSSGSCTLSYHEDSIRAHEELLCSKVEDNEQPFFWLERDLARKLLDGENFDRRALINELSAKGIIRS